MSLYEDTDADIVAVNAKGVALSLCWTSGIRCDPAPDLSSR